MRSRLAIGFLLFICACGSNMGIPGGTGGSAGSGGGGSGGTGGSGGGNGSDMSFSAAGDMSAAAVGCNEILSCIAMCGGLGNRQCVSMCRSGATQAARGLLTQLSGCLRQACYVHPDATIEPCTMNGAPSMQCTQCIDNSTMGTGACHTEYAACAANN